MATPTNRQLEERYAAGDKGAGKQSIARINAPVITEDMDELDRQRTLAEALLKQGKLK